MSFLPFLKKAFRSFRQFSFMPDLLHVWKCTEWYVLLLSFAKHPLAFISSVECCIFNLLLSLDEVHIQSNGEDKQWRRKVEWICMNFFIFLGMDVTIYSVDIVGEKNFVERVSLHCHKNTMMVWSHQSCFIISCLPP